MACIQSNDLNDYTTVEGQRYQHLLIKLFNNKTACVFIGVLKMRSCIEQKYFITYLHIAIDAFTSRKIIDFMQKTIEVFHVLHSFDIGLCRKIYFKTLIAINFKARDQLARTTNKPSNLSQ